MPKQTLSAMTPNYNHARYIGRAIEAVVTQSRPPDEYLILDDASTDNSMEIIEHYASKYPFIRVLRNECNLGVLRSQARLVNEASGDYFYSGAADDFVRPGFFESAMDMAAKHAESGIIFGRVGIADENSNLIDVPPLCPEWTEPQYVPPDAFLKSYLHTRRPAHVISPTAAAVYKRSALDEVGGFRSELGFWADTFAIFAIALKYGLCYLHRHCATFHVMPESFGSTQMTNPAKLLEVVTAVASTMRSVEFRDRFPEEYVQDWKSDYDEIIANQCVHDAIEAFNDHQTTRYPELFDTAFRASPHLFEYEDAAVEWLLKGAMLPSVAAPYRFVSTVLSNLPASAPHSLRVRRNRTIHFYLPLTRLRLQKATRDWGVYASWLPHRIGNYCRRLLHGRSKSLPGAQ